MPKEYMMHKYVAYMKRALPSDTVLCTCCCIYYCRL